jgi:hypothetical protein
LLLGTLMGRNKWIKHFINFYWWDCTVMLDLPETMWLVTGWKKLNLSGKKNSIILKFQSTMDI